MSELSRLSKVLGVSQNKAILILKKHNINSKSLTFEQAQMIISKETGKMLPSGDSQPQQPPITSDYSVEQEVKNQLSTISQGHVSYIELADTEEEAKKYFALTTKLGIDPEQIPQSDIEILKEMMIDSNILNQADEELDELQRTVISNQFEEFQIRLENAIINSEIAADVVHKASSNAYYRRLAQLSGQSYLDQQQDDYQSKMIRSLNPQPSILQSNQPQPESDFSKKKNYRRKLLQG